MCETIYNNEPILEITHETVQELKNRALRSKRGRARLCMHFDNDEPTQEMLIVFHHSSFMPPHRHPSGKSESYHLIEGSMDVYFFDDTGTVRRVINMGEKDKKKSFLYRLSSKTWHMPKPTSEWLVYHETYTGPFIKNEDVEFPGWSPLEEEKSKVKSFLLECERQKATLTQS